MAQFQNIIDNQLTQCTTAYQWGYAVPMKPAAFMDNLLEQAVAFGLNNWQTGRETVQAITSATIEYAIFYGQLLTKPMPENPTPEFEAWYNEVHPLGGPTS